MPGERLPRRRVGARCGSTTAASSAGASLASSETGAPAMPGERRPRRRVAARCGSSGAVSSCADDSLASSDGCDAAMPGERRPRRRVGARWGSSGVAGDSFTASADGTVSGAASAARRRVVLRRRGRGSGSSGGSACWGSCTISSDLSFQVCQIHSVECCSSTRSAPRTYSAVVATLKSEPPSTSASTAARAVSMEV